MQEFDYDTYSSMPWMVAKTLLAVCLMTLVYLLYALHELPWSLYGSGTGIVILFVSPFFAGLILGFSFERPWKALAFSVAMGFVSIGLCILIFMLPKILGLAEYLPGFMADVMFYGFFMPFIMTISFVPAGAMLAASTNVYE